MTATLYCIHSLPGHMHRGMEFHPVSKDCKTSVVSQPDFLYGPQVIDVIMRKPGKVPI